MEHDRPEDGKILTEQEGVMFPSTPIWERGHKRRRSAARVGTPAAVSEPRSFAPEEPAALKREAAPGATLAQAPSQAEASDRAHEIDAPARKESLVEPIGRAEREPRPHRLGVPAGVAGAIAVAGVAAAGAWYLTRGDEGVPELAPGQPATAVATAPLTTQPAPLPLNPPPAVADARTRAEAARDTPAPAVARTERRIASGSRARPAASTGAATVRGVDASATLPDAPQPYTSLNPGAAPAAVSPGPAPASAEPIPSTPPTAPLAEPPSTAPQPPLQSATPPQP